MKAKQKRLRLRNREAIEKNQINYPERKKSKKFYQNLLNSPEEGIKRKARRIKINTSMTNIKRNRSRRRSIKNINIIDHPLLEKVAKKMFTLKKKTNKCSSNNTSCTNNLKKNRKLNKFNLR